MGSDDEWEFGVDELDGEDEGDEADVADSDPIPVEPIEPESVSVENALFVALGALGTLLVFVSATL